jgi:hypothetical protein
MAFAVIAPPLAVDWDSNEAEWRSHLRAALAKRVAMSALRMGWVDLPGFGSACELSIDSAPQLPRLLLLPSTDGVIPAVWQEDEIANADVWRKVIQEATDAVGVDRKTFCWRAHVASEHYDLRDALLLGPVSLTPTHSAFVEYDTSALRGWASFHGASVAWSFPTRVEAATDAASWDLASEQANEDLHRLCAVLSVASDSLWEVKESPHHADPPITDIPTHRMLENHDAVELDELERQEFVGPEWLDNAAWTASSGTDLVGPLAAFFRGLRVEEFDPATALTLYVAAIEGIGTRYADLERCGVCGSRTGAMQRFRSALAIVAEPDEIKELAKLYTHRSQGAHGGLIEGQPLSTGRVHSGGFFHVAPSGKLSGRVWSARRVARGLLELGLRRGLPGDVHG